MIDAQLAGLKVDTMAAEISKAAAPGRCAVRTGRMGVAPVLLLRALLALMLARGVCSRAGRWWRRRQPAAVMTVGLFTLGLRSNQRAYNSQAGTQNIVQAGAQILTQNHPARCDLATIF